jgi:hypothetical protein
MDDELCTQLLKKKGGMFLDEGNTKELFVFRYQRFLFGGTHGVKYSRLAQ